MQTVIAEAAGAHGVSKLSCFRSSHLEAHENFVNDIGTTANSVLVMAKTK